MPQITKSHHGLLETTHGKFVKTRRARILAAHLSDLIAPSARVLDVGSGDGLIAHLVMASRPDVDIQGIDVLIRDTLRNPVKQFDGHHLPETVHTFDTITFVDVLHHCDDPEQVIGDAIRPTVKTVIIKDVLNDGFLADSTLRFMDRVGNERYGVYCPMNFWPQSRWLSTFEQMGMKVAHWRGRLGLYPWPASLVFERSMHFISVLTLR